MAYEYNVPHVDFVEEFQQDDGADAFFDIHEQLENKLKINESAEDSECRHQETASVSNARLSTCATCVSGTEKRDNGVLQEITSSVQNIAENRKRKSDVDHKVIKFISLAEGVREFQGHIRETSHSHSQKIGGKKNSSLISKFHVTIPQSPMLLSKTRARPVNYPSAEERLQTEIEEIESFKLKAKPVNKKIFEPPKLGRRVPRPPLVIEPFKLTEYKRKEIKECSSPFQFKAKPVPKGMLQHPLGVPEKIVLPVTSPQTPSFVAKQRSKLQTIEEVNGKLTLLQKSPAHANVPLGKPLDKTLPRPFSFEERDRMMIKNKEEKIKRVIQEEKEARIFHANPVPAYIKKCTKEISNESRSSSRVSLPNDDEKKTPFKAQPATVLRKEPFKPKLPERSIIQPDNVTLHTEHRALTRKEYDQYLKQREEEIEAELQRRKEAELIKQEQEIAILRQQAVHKAQPIRSYLPIPGRPKTSVTSPVTPKFSKRFNK